MMGTHMNIMRMRMTTWGGREGCDMCVYITSGGRVMRMMKRSMRDMFCWGKIFSFGNSESLWSFSCEMNVTMPVNRGFMSPYTAQVTRDFPTWFSPPVGGRDHALISSRWFQHPCHHLTQSNAPEHDARQHKEIQDGGMH